MFDSCLLNHFQFKLYLSKMSSESAASNSFLILNAPMSHRRILFLAIFFPNRAKAASYNKKIVSAAGRPLPVVPLLSCQHFFLITKRRKRNQVRKKRKFRAVYKKKNKMRNRYELKIQSTDLLLSGRINISFFSPFLLSSLFSILSLFSSIFLFISSQLL